LFFFFVHPYHVSSSDAHAHAQDHDDG
jgi:hypothetical protein